MRAGGAGSPATPAAAARSSTWRATRAPIRGEAVPRTEKVIRRMLGSDERYRFFRAASFSAVISGSMPCASAASKFNSTLMPFGSTMNSW